jgi:hypothetical protein
MVTRWGFSTLSAIWRKRRGIIQTKIKEVSQWQPGKAGGALEGTPQKDRRFAYIKYDV